MSATNARSYRLLDSGNGRRLEAVGPWILDRQAAGAAWRPRLPAERWRAAHGRHVRSNAGGGSWKMSSAVPESWTVERGGLLLEARPTPFGHVGLFPEAAGTWTWLEDAVHACPGPPEVLNLFAYTGGATLALARSGARVCHVDAAHGSVQQARRNAALNGLEDRPVRWIVEDCRTFLAREERRGHCYQGLLLDPPSFGRGRRGEVFKIEEHLPDLLESCRRVLSTPPEFVLLTCHTPGYSPLVLENLLEDSFGRDDMEIESGELTLAEDGSSRRLPAGSWCRSSPGPAASTARGVDSE